MSGSGDMMAERQARQVTTGDEMSDRGWWTLIVADLIARLRRSRCAWRDWHDFPADDPREPAPPGPPRAGYFTRYAGLPCRGCGAPDTREHWRLTPDPAPTTWRHEGADRG